MTGNDLPWWIIIVLVVLTVFMMAGLCAIMIQYAAPTVTL